MSRQNDRCWRYLPVKDQSTVGAFSCTSFAVNDDVNITGHNALQQAAASAGIRKCSGIDPDWINFGAQLLAG